MLDRAKHAWLRGDVLGAKMAAEEVLRKSPRTYEALSIVGGACINLGQPEAAIAALKKAVELRPTAHDPMYNIGLAFITLGDFKQAESWLRRSDALKPGQARVLNNLGLALRSLNRLDEATACYERAVKADPSMVASVFGMASGMLDQGRVEEAVAAYRRVFEAVPQERGARANLLLALNYVEADPLMVRREHEAFGAWLESEHPAMEPPTESLCPRDPERRLRVGFLSPDFREHSCSYFMFPLIERLDRERFEVLCYSAAPKEDAVTERFRGMSSVFRSVFGRDAASAARMIRDDRVDILFDMTGHTGGARLDVFARKPAPIQITYLGYPNTTGLSRMDYRLIDGVSDPVGSEAHCTERLMRMPRGRCVWCYRPAPDEVAGPVSALPCLQTGAGGFTFASFNNNSKITAEVMKAWARILLAVPGSRLLLKNKWLHDPGTAERRLREFESLGVVRDRIEIAPYTPSTADHLGVYTRADLQLDTFPYNGTTTTCESLWQGVPVVTFEGVVHAARVGSSLMRAAGLGEFVGKNVDEYVRIAVAWAHQKEALAAMREGMRDRLRRSVLMDESGFAEAVGGLLREAWREHCVNKAGEGAKGGAA